MSAQDKVKRHILGLINALYELKYGQPPPTRWWEGVKLVVAHLI